MPKPKSSRSAVRTTPQPEKHQYVRAVFVDDYGRDRALTVETAKSFSKKKLGAASSAGAKKADREMAWAIEASDRKTARAIRKLRKQERKADRSIARFFRRKIRTVEQPTGKIKHRPPKPRMIKPSRGMSALPSYGGFIRDRQNRIGVFIDIRYYSSRTSKPGVAIRTAKYIWNGAALDADGVPVFRSNIGATIEEVVCGLDHLEQVNRSAQRGAKILNSAVLAVDHRWTREQMLEVGEAWAKERFGQYALPYAIALHEPPPDGDERNWHIHALWSWRPLERVDEYEWLVAETLRTELDGREGLRLLRERFAAVSTVMSFHRGECDVYTGLSHAARGLPIEPQIKLYEEKTRRARAGEFVPDNEKNHERVLRSKAALIDDDLRREDERLAREAERIRRSAAKVAKTMRTFKAPSLPFTTVALSASVRQISAQTFRALSIANARVPKFPIMTVPSRADGLSQRLRPLREALRSAQFANLRSLAFSSAAAVSVTRKAVSPHQPLRTRLRPPSVPAATKVKPAFPQFSVTFVTGKVHLPKIQNLAMGASWHSASKKVRPLSLKFVIAAMPNAILSPAIAAERWQGVIAKALAMPRPVPFRSHVSVQWDAPRLLSLGRKIANLRIAKLGASNGTSAPPEQSSRPHPFRVELRRIVPPKRAILPANFPRLSPVSVFASFSGPRPTMALARLRVARSVFAPRPALQIPAKTAPPEVARIPRVTKSIIARNGKLRPAYSVRSFGSAPRRSQIFGQSEIAKRLSRSIPPFLQPAYKPPRAVSFPASVISRASASAVSRTAAGPKSQTPDASRLGVLEVPRSVSSSSFEQLQTTKESAKRFLSDTSATVEKSEPKVRRSTSKPPPRSSSPWLLLAILAERRSAIRKTPRGLWSISSELLKEAGLTAEEMEAAPLQKVLKQQAALQRAELRELTRFVAKDPANRLVRRAGGWRLVSTAPEPLRRAIYHWQFDAQVQDALSELSSFMAIGEDDQKAVTERASHFLARVFENGPSDVGEPLRAMFEGEERKGSGPVPGKFPPPNGFGFG